MEGETMGQRVCEINGCGSERIVARGMCGKHYQRMAREGLLGEFQPTVRPSLSLRERFERIGWTVTASGCWEWNGSLNSHGYGQISPGRRGTDGENVPLICSRVAWELEHGPIPDGLAICHRCDNPPCVNPAHLFQGTKADNNGDMARKKRTLNGERRPQAKLTDAEVAEIRARYSTGGTTQQQLAHAFGVNDSAISMIINGHRRRFPTYPTPSSSSLSGTTLLAD